MGHHHSHDDGDDEDESYLLPAAADDTYYLLMLLLMMMIVSFRFISLVLVHSTQQDPINLPTMSQPQSNTSTPPPLNPLCDVDRSESLLLNLNSDCCCCDVVL